MGNSFMASADIFRRSSRSMSACTSRATKYEDEQCSDASFVLEKDRRDLVNGLHLFEALLDRLLTLVGLEDLAGAETSVVG